LDENLPLPIPFDLIESSPDSGLHSIFNARGGLIIRAAKSRLSSQIQAENALLVRKPWTHRLRDLQFVARPSG
jgi:hypothetical protein